MYYGAVRNSPKRIDQATAKAISDGKGAVMKVFYWLVVASGSYLISAHINSFCAHVAQAVIAVTR